MAIKISGTTVIDDNRHIINVNNFGNSDTVYTGNGSGLSGISFGTNTFEASGAIADGIAVKLNSDGTVSSATKTSTGINTVSAITTFTTSRSFDYAPVFDSTNNKVVIFYRDYGDSSKGKAVVATISGDSVSYGTVVEFESASTSDPCAAFDSDNGKVVVFYSADSKGYAKVGTVSGTSITFGSRVEFNGGSTDLYGDSATYDPDEGKVIISYRDSGNSSYGTSRVGTVSGTSISFGSEVVFRSATCAYISSTYDSTNGKVVVAFRDDGASSYGKIVGGDVSGTSISFDSGSGGINEKTFESGRADYIRVVHDASAGVNVVAYQDDGDSQKGKVQPLRIDGNGFETGTNRTFESNQIRNMGLAYDSKNQRVVISYSDDTNSFQGRAIVCNIDSVGNVNGYPSFGSTLTFTTGYTGHINSTYDSNADRTIITYIDDTPDNGESVLVNCGGLNAFSANTGVVFDDGNSTEIDSVYDPDTDRFIVVYEESNIGRAVVGKVVGTEVTFGDPVIFNNGYTAVPQITYDTNSNKVVINYRDSGDGGKGKCIVGTVTGGTTNTISFGDETEYASSIQNPAITFDPDNNKVAVVYRDAGDSDKGKVRIGTVSGDSITFGTAAEFSTNTVTQMQAVYDTNANRVVIVYRHNGNSDRGTAIVGTVSGTSISFGTAVVFHSAAINNPGVCFDSTNNKVVIAYRDGSSLGRAIVGTVSGTSISFGTAVTYARNSSVTYMVASYDSSNNKVVIAHKSSDSHGRAYAGQVDGTSIIFNPGILFHDGDIGGADHAVGSSFIPGHEKTVVVFRDRESNVNYGTAVTINMSETDITSDNYIGIAAEAISDGSTGSITTIGGINDSQSGLTTAASSFVQFDGTIGTTDTGVAAGIVIDDDKVIVKG
tara:strand:+ start:368 stop:3031 length:2664 start_codon:yes stop_codon:yes gene_type:complete